ncbi:MAG: DMT family transporter [Planctomycetota bacterium]|nr:DMT family transporter [Planctomycetota bacterium]
MRGKILRSYWPIMLSCALWAWPMVIIKLLQRQGFDLHTQNFFRYLAASVTLQAVGWAMDPAAMRRCFRDAGKFVVPAILASVFQIVWVMGVYKSMPAAGALLTRSTVLWGLLFSFLFFPEERRMMRSPFFIAGTAAAIAGLCGFILSRPASGSDPGEYSLGLVFLAVSAILWAGYGISIKFFLRGVPPVAAFATTASLACAILLIPALLAGNPAHIIRVPAGWSLLLLVSGPLFIGGTQVLMIESIRRVGVAATNVITLSIPLFTAASSFAVLGETLTARQWLFGLMLIGGLAAVVLRAGTLPEAVASPPAPPPEIPSNPPIRGN